MPTCPEGISGPSMPLWCAEGESDQCMCWAREQHPQGLAWSMSPTTLPPKRLFSPPSLPAAQAFQGGLVVREHLEDPEGKRKNQTQKKGLPPH